MIRYLQVAGDRAAEIPTTFRTAPRTLPEGCLFTGEDLRLKIVAVLGRVLIAAEQVAAA